MKYGDFVTYGEGFKMFLRLSGEWDPKIDANLLVFNEKRTRTIPLMGRQIMFLLWRIGQVRNGEWTEL